MRFLLRLAPRSVVSQITGIVAVSVLLGIGLTSAILFLFFREPDARDGDSLSATGIGKVIQIAQTAETPEELDKILDIAQRAGFSAIRVPLAEFTARPADAPMPIAAGVIAFQLRTLWGIETRSADFHPGAGDGLIVPVDDRSALLFAAPSLSTLWRFILRPTVLIIITMLVFVVFLSAYAVRSIIAPLSALGRATESFGHSPDDDRLIDRRGPREIGQMADALNDMRTRIRALIDDRTRMLAAISHDLRTPLTRLRLRAERIDDPELRDGILYEVVRISSMLDETLEYLRPGTREERMAPVDLPSLLQTICTEFGDVGHGVTYAGPPRLAWVCRANALTRAVSNVVDNGVQHGSAVQVGLRIGKGGMAEIVVADDGPGIPAPLREKVFDPFFKGDHSRPAATGRGFGLGLSIARDVVRGHGGRIELLDRLPHGLVVKMSLPRNPADLRPEPPATSLNIT
ncbi:sensor histidine kinase [Inquilinus sp. YAF38]|uniref:sensor histidine kinase n=1 Tax=Inquilinus sp. YAF38 TaxID=3233084 RepID=UPI003F930892